jgi:hypothetical protein
MKNIFYTLIIIFLFSCQEYVNQTKGNGEVTISKREVTENFTKTTVLKWKPILIYKAT